jgi:hypothetical protein
MTSYDDAGNIGKRYRRQDVIGTPFCITIDEETLNNNTVTVRDRDTMNQVVISVDKIIEYIKMYQYILARNPWAMPNRHYNRTTLIDAKDMIVDKLYLMDRGTYHKDKLYGNGMYFGSVVKCLGIPPVDTPCYIPENGIITYGELINDVGYYGPSSWIKKTGNLLITFEGRGWELEDFITDAINSKEFLNITNKFKEIYDKMIIDERKPSEFNPDWGMN